MNPDFYNYPVKTLIEKLSGHVTPERLEKIKKVASQRFENASIVLENIYDRGNASAVMRSAEAFGFYQMHMIEISEKFKESKRVTQGAHKWLQIQKWSSTKECIAKLKAEGKKIFVTHLDPQALPLEQMDVSEPWALCFGNEKDGASPELLELCDETVFIPMRGFVQSFNISVAAALCLYELQKRCPKSDKINQELIAYYLTQSVDHWQRYL